MLRGFLGTGTAHLVVGGNAHELQPGFNRETLIEDEPDESGYFPWARIVSDSGYGLLSGSVPQAEALNEGYYMRLLRVIPGVDVSSFSGVAEEGSVP